MATVEPFLLQQPATSRIAGKLVLRRNRLGRTRNLGVSREGYEQEVEQRGGEWIAVTSVCTRIPIPSLYSLLLSSVLHQQND